MREIQSKIGTGCLFVLYGQRGTGKTQIVTSIGAAAIAAAGRASDERLPRYAKASDLFREVRASYRPASLISETDVLDSFIRPSLLVIDEAQERGDSAFEDRTLAHIVDARYDAMRDTILVTNLQRKELVEALGLSISNRVLECGRAIECGWPSFRVKGGCK